MRAHRYALAMALRTALPPDVLALHWFDNPLRVKVSAPGQRRPLQVVAGSQRDNMIPMARTGRGGGRPAVRSHGRAARRVRSLALRGAVRHGWDSAAVAHALLGSDEPTLW